MTKSFKNKNAELSDLRERFNTQRRSIAAYQESQEVLRKEISGKDKELSLRIKEILELREKVRILANLVNSQNTAPVFQSPKEQSDPQHNSVYQRLGQLEQWSKNHTDTHMILNQNNGELAQRIVALEKRLDFEGKAQSEQNAELVQLRKSASLNGQHIIVLEERDAKHSVCIEQLLRDVKILQTQMKNLLLQNNGLTNAVLKLQRKRDAKGRYKK